MLTDDAVISNGRGGGHTVDASCLSGGSNKGECWVGGERDAGVLEPSVSAYLIGCVSGASGGGAGCWVVVVVVGFRVVVSSAH